VPFPYAGEVCALLAPLVWSLAVILYKRTAAPAVSINLFKNVLALGLLLGTLVLTEGAFPADRSAWDWGRLALSGLLGLALADTLLFMGLARIGASKVAIVDTVYAPSVVLLAWALLGEVPSAWFLVGAALVLAGVALATVERGALRVEARAEWAGMLLAGAAVLSTSIAVILAKPVLETSGLVEVTATRLGFGVLGQAVWLTGSGGWKRALAVFVPGPVWWTLLPGAVLGAYVSMMLWLGGYKWADASVAAVLNQMATVYMLAMAAGILRETLRPAQVVGALVAAAGAVWIVLTGG
jgi:drug/metabolite transporter (DMT)-like permease